MDEVEEKKVEVPRIDPLFFVVRELDSIKGTTREEFDKVYNEFDKVYNEFDKVYKEFDKVYAEFDKVYKEFDKVYTTIENLRKETKEEFGKVYTTIENLRKETKEEFEKVYGRFNRVEDKFHELKVFTVRLVFTMVGLIIAGVGILFQLMR